MITAVRDGVAVHPDGERIRVRGGADQWAAGLLCRVRDAATLALFGLTDGPIGYLPGSQGVQGPPGSQVAQGPAGLLASPNELEGLPCQSPNGPGTTEAVVDHDYGSHPGATTGNGYNGIGFACIRADDLEPNDTRAQATDATLFNSSGGFRWASGTVSPPGNDDWFKLTAVDLGGNVIFLDSVRSLMDVYRNGTHVAAGTQCYTTSAGAADWEIRVYAARLDYYNLDFSLPPSELVCP
jgi:hypothetical protein